MGRFILWAIELDAVEAVCSNLMKVALRCRGYKGICARHPVVYLLFDTQSDRDRAYTYLAESYDCRVTKLYSEA